MTFKRSGIAANSSNLKTVTSKRPKLPNLNPNFYLKTSENMGFKLIFHLKREHSAIHFLCLAFTKRR